MGNRSTVEEAWRVVSAPGVLADAAGQGERLGRVLERADELCQQLARCGAADDPQTRGSFESARLAIGQAQPVVRQAAVRLRHLAG